MLSLEVLSSRVMTPYFGVSLYIRAGIRSITLPCLAVGYSVGGRLSKRLAAPAQGALFLAMPVLGAVAVLVACLVYPFAFPLLARFDLVLGSFLGSAVLLAVPLVCLSAMNPLLISLRTAAEKGGGTDKGDGGAGLVLFVSTAGSVVGVLVTAFALIPGFTNFEALLWLSVALCGFAAAGAMRTPGLDAGRRRQVLAAGAVIGALCVALVAVQERFFGLLTALDADPAELTILGEYSTVFGNIKVARVRANKPAAQPLKVYLQDGLVQNRATDDDVSVSMYTYVLDRLAGGFAPDARDAVVLGLGAGFVPRDLKKRGVNVSVVEINPVSVAAARDHFGFDPAGFDLSITDARTYVRACRRAFDVAVVDLFQGDATPDYLMSAEFFADLNRCLRRDGVVVMNAFFDDEDETPNRRLLATIASAFPTVVLYRPGEGNAFVAALNRPVESAVSYDLAGIPEPLRPAVLGTLDAARLVRPATLLGYAPVSDRQNHFSILMAGARMAQRQWLTNALPARFLMN
ncbi:MAG: fused MFS/spermidine synthase [Rhodospirillaceae bacterium]